MQNQQRYNQRRTTRTGYTNISNNFVSAGNNQQPPAQIQNNIQIQPVKQPEPVIPTPVKIMPEPKLEMKEDIMTVSMTESNGSDANDELRKLKKINFKRKISGRERRLRQNRKLKKLLTPRNATVALHELSGHETSAISEFQVKQNGNQFVAEVTINNVKYEGYGSSKMAAKNNASEKALRDLVVTKLQQQKLEAAQAEQKPVVETTPQAGEDVEMSDESEQKDDVPMLQLASFALHKLFAEWESEGFEIPLFKNDGATAGDGATATPKAPAVPKPVKVRNDLPPNAENMHPVVLLSVMRPCTAYMDLGSSGAPPNISHTVGCQVDGENFIGAGRSKKDARKSAAMEVLKKLFNWIPSAQALAATN